jgi:dUTPase
MRCTQSLLPTKTQKVQFPPLEYLGVVTNKYNGRRLAIIKHNNQTHRIRQGDKIANCTVFNIQKDSIQIILNG